MLVLIDNYDSFTFNLVHYFQQEGVNPSVFRNDAVSVEGIIRMRPEAIVISPGPGRPKDAGISLELIRFFARRIPILGVCLGHQVIAEAFGGTVVHAPQPVHGKIHRMEHDGSGLFANLPSPIQVTLYNSLMVGSVPEEFRANAWMAEPPRAIMGIRHRLRPVFGVQYHPEALLTEKGHEIVRAFLNTIG